MICKVVENQGKNQSADLMHLERPGLLRCHCSVLCLALWRKLSGRTAEQYRFKIPISTGTYSCYQIWA